MTIFIRMTQVCAVVLCLAATAIAEIPQMITCQGRVTDTTGALVADGDYQVTFSIFATPTDGVPLWSSGPQTVAVSGGVFTYLLGSTVPLPDSLFRTNADCWLSYAHAADSEAVQRVHLVSVPYAFKARWADTASVALAAPSGSPSGWTDAGTVVRLTDGIDSIGIGTALPLARVHIVGDALLENRLTVGTGNSNTGYQAFVSGEGNSAEGNYAAIVNGTDHHAIGNYAAIGGGSSNTASGSYSFVAGGQGDTASGAFTHVTGLVNAASGNFAGISGGRYNRANGEASAIGGGGYNAASGRYSAIAGGGPSDDANPTSTSNAVFDDYGTIGGGGANSVGSDNGDPEDHTYGTVSGGQGNTAVAAYVTIAGGSSNLADAYAATVSGGFGNTASGNYAGITSGQSNTAEGLASIVSGGRSNAAGGSYATVGGGQSNVAAATGAAIGGGLGNRVDGNVTTIAGGAQHHIAGDYSAILGGFADTIDASAHYSYLFGIGSRLTADSTFMVDLPHIRFGTESTGYEFPSVRGTDLDVLATDGSGQLSWQSTADLPSKWEVIDSALHTTAWWGIARGGAGNLLLGDSTHTLVNLGVACTTANAIVYQGRYASVTGGLGNAAVAEWAHVGGGRQNRAASYSATVAGGSQNVADGNYSAIAGGSGNIAEREYCFVGGGSQNFATGPFAVVAGGQWSQANGQGSFVGSGYWNIASGNQSCVPGGHQNRATGKSSLAAGNKARALHAGAIVLSANDDYVNDTDRIESGCPEQMVLRADGRFFLTSDTSMLVAPCDSTRFLNTSTGAHLTTGGDWTNASDREAKERFTAIDVRQLLERLARLPIMEWSYKANPDVRHVGPTSQDFQDAFGLGGDDRTISTVDPAGIALAAIQELSRRTERIEEQQRQIDALQDQLEELRRMIKDQAAR